MRVWIVLAIVLAALSSLLFLQGPSSADEEVSRNPTSVSESVGAGRWQSRGDGLGSRDWHLQLKRFDDNSIEGALVVVGSPELRDVRLEGRVEGDDVYGALIDASDRQVGTFTGAIFAGGVSGSYTTANGDTGTWTWAGPAAARNLKANERTIDDGARP